MKIIKMKNRFTMFIMLMFLLFLIPTVTNAKEERYFSFDVRENSGIINLKASVIGGELNLPKDSYAKGSYEIKLFSFNNKEVDSAFFDFGLRNVVVKLLYQDDIEKIKIFKNQKEIFVENIGYLANVCGDKTCQAHESRETCKEDCLSGGADDYCDGEKDGICDLDCKIKESDIDCSEPAMLLKISRYIFLALCFIVSIFLLIFGIKKYLSQKNDNY